ncbi:retinol dehydrogenase 13-like [Daphnia carinata]|uniref:retinol dehydrogenase 13-like n=1 Tax=Daphnia carinata TaxID=120202 RepID=UPI002580B1BE|nr:retinol dehydrogenase 13-like [Daphnia carinata]
MSVFTFDVPNSVIGALIFTVALKIYYEATKGICKSSKRLDGKTIIVTGSNTGVGKATALDLASRGGRIILACRNLKKALVAKDEIVEKSRNPNVLIKELDLASFSSIRRFAADVQKTEPKLHILINNAGCGDIEQKTTENGLEQQMQTNYFGPFLLTNLLLGLMIETGEKEEENVRIVNVGSDGHFSVGDLNLDDLNFCYERSTKTIWSPVQNNLWLPIKIYGTSKLCVILSSCELARKLELLGKPVTVNSLHPGGVYTEFTRFSKILSVLMTLYRPFLKSPAEGAQTSIYLAVADEVSNVSGQYFRDCKIAQPSKLVRDKELAKKLWEVTERLVRLEPKEKFF